MKNFFFCILCSVIIYESYLGEHHIHLPEQSHKVPQNQITPSYFISNGTTSYKPENMDWLQKNDNPNLYRKPDLTYLYTSHSKLF